MARGMRRQRGKRGAGARASAVPAHFRCNAENPVRTWCGHYGSSGRWWPLSRRRSPAARLVGNNPCPTWSDRRRTSPLVSVVMAVHNGAPYLRDAVQSVLAQSHGHLELLLCDDASTDDGPPLRSELAAQDARAPGLRSDTEIRSGCGAQPGARRRARRLDRHRGRGRPAASRPHRGPAGDIAADTRRRGRRRPGALRRQSGTTLLAPLG
jgi:hypothetical protein